MPVASAGTAVRPTPSAFELPAQEHAAGVVADRADQLDLDAAAGEPNRQVGALPSRADADLGGHVRAGAWLRCGTGGDIQQRVADDDHLRPAGHSGCRVLKPSLVVCQYPSSGSDRRQQSQAGSPSRRVGMSTRPASRSRTTTPSDSR